MADAFDFEQSPVDLPDELLQVGQMGQPFVDSKIMGVAESPLEEFRLLGIDFISLQEALDTSTPIGQAMFTIIAAMAELERSVIRERVVAGMYARVRGTKSGKPIGRPRVIFRRDEAREL